MESSLIQNPLFQTVLAPFTVALILAAVLRLAGGPGHGAAVMGIAIAVGFLVGYGLFEGIPSFPPPAAKQKVFYLTALGGLVGLALDLIRRSATMERAAIVLFPALCLVWFAWRPLLAGPGWGLLAHLALLWAGFTLVLWHLAAVGRREGGALTANILLIVMAAGASGVAMAGASITLSLLFGTVAAAAGALALWDYAARLLERGHSRFGAAALLGGSGSLIGVAGVLSLYTPQASQVALAVLLAVPFSTLVAAHLNLGGGSVERLGAPIVMAVIAAIPAVIAVGVAYLGGMP